MTVPARIGRPPGSPNKRSKDVVTRLEQKHKFSIVDELVEMYQVEKQIFMHVAEKMKNNLKAGPQADPLDGLTEEEIDIYKNSEKEMLTILRGLLGYAHPKLKAYQISGQGNENIVFQIQVGNTPVAALVGSNQPQIGHSEVVDAEYEEAQS